MKKFLLGSVALVALSAAGAANAAELPVKAPPPPPVPAWSWAGWYIGAHVGGMWGTADFSDPFGPSIFGDKVRTPGFLGGGQIGYNWQAPNSPWVFGVQADISGFDSEGTNTCFAYSGSAINATCRVRPEVAGTLTGRVGHVFGPGGRTLLYVKGGLAWSDSRVDMATNNAYGGIIGPAITSNSSTLGLWGGTVGGGVEYALTPAWSLFAEYDYLGFGKANVANLGSVTISPVGVVTGVVPPGSSGVTQNISEFKLGLNYKFGVDPRALWPAAVVGSPYPVKAPFFKAPVAVSAPGWEFEGGVRYMYSWGQFHKDLGQFVTSGAPRISSVSRLTYDDMKTNSGEFFARIDTPWNVFVKGFIGGGSTSNGHMNDEDFGLVPNPPNIPYLSYSNTLSSNVTGNIDYGVVDVGYDFLRGASYKVGAFVGYTQFHQSMDAFNCVQIANPTVAGAPCVGVPIVGSAIITENDTWKALRVGFAGDVMLTDRVKLSGDVAYLPYATFSGVDNHFFINTGTLAEIFPESSNGGNGVQLESLVSYYITPQFSVGVGGRYWGMWTTNGQFFRSFPTPASSPNQFFRGTTEQAGVFLQAAYKFGLPGR